jgi:hypothetical protein
MQTGADFAGFATATDNISDNAAIVPTSIFFI